MNILRTKMSLNTEQVLRGKVCCKGETIFTTLHPPSLVLDERKETVAWKIWGKIIMNLNSALQRSVW